MRNRTPSNELTVIEKITEAVVRADGMAVEQLVDQVHPAP